jgi:hypothetical protein
VVVDTALSLPDVAKLGDVERVDPYASTYRDSGAKRVLIDVGRRWLPRDFDVQRKRGFAMPFDAWLRGPLREVMEDSLGDRAVRARGLLAPQAVATVRDRFNRREASWAEPWLLMMLELWCREVLDAASSVSSTRSISGVERAAISDSSAPGALAAAERAR